ncbi:uncharacterized protein BDW70DRAFT_161891 [Aspergillus foveolatus]|uniref:uncharacterized protein n=1 Tax=Aspergillus foveolatus TaxID=210207 RepID=UPI003CCDB886
MTETWEFYSKALRAMLGLSVQRAMQQIQAVGHRWTWRDTENTKNVVIIGGSYAGIHLARRLSETLPTGYKAVFVERNSHFNHLYVFPRFGVVPGHEHTAFAPYDGIPSFGPRGILSHVRDSVSSLTTTQVRLASGKSIDYEYLAFATGTWQPPPSKASSTKKAEACAELQASQKWIQHANRIAVVGGGPVGIQIASDIASYFPEKKVTLVHSRAQLLPKFGPRLHKHVCNTMKQLNIDVALGERPQLNGNGADAGPGTLSFKDAERPDMTWCPPDAANRRPIQFQSPYLALGDVAKTKGPRMARAARAQADVVASDILSMIHQGESSTSYVPQIYESVIKLTLGRSRWIFYGQDDREKEVSVTGADKDKNIKVQHVWEGLGVKQHYIELDGTLSQKLQNQAAREARLVGFWTRHFNELAPPLPESINLSGRTAIVTGSKIGLGFESARHLLSLQLSHLILAVRSQSRADAAAAELQRQHPEATIEVWLLDMESYKSIANFVHRCKTTLPRAHVAILNAGLVIGRFQEFPRPNTKPRCRSTISTALLTLQLLPCLKRSSVSNEPGRLTIVGSDTVYGAPRKLRQPSPASLLKEMDTLKTFPGGLDQYELTKLYSLFPQPS